MKIDIRRFDKDVPLPEYKTKGAVAMDLAARTDATVPPHTIGYVPLNVAIKPPSGHVILMAARSSLHKRGLLMANGIGIFDTDFSGDGDEYTAILYNFTDMPAEIKKGDRLMQIMAIPFDRVEWNEVESMTDPTRGGIGSTGK